MRPPCKISTKLLVSLLVLGVAGYFCLQVFSDSSSSNKNGAHVSRYKNPYAVVAGKDNNAPLNSAGRVVPGHLVSAVNAGEIKTNDDIEAHSLGLKKHGFNDYLSSRLSVYRNVPDTRPPRCLSATYDSMNKATVVISFYNESPTVLLRTVHSVISRTPTHLLHNIILIDDNSDHEILSAPLDKYISRFLADVVTVIKNKQREGLIRSRMIGAEAATSKVLIFLDSHVEVNVGWIEPLLSRLFSGEARVVLPVIDIIDPKTFEYKSSPPVRGGFTWSLRYSWERIPPSILQQKLNYVPTPAMAGGLFAVNKELFFLLGGYDKLMDIWGGENIEMSLRTWMCGGIIEISMCSRVGHIFRDRRPYSSPDGENTFLKNSLRLAEVWLDEESKAKFISAVGLTSAAFDTVDVSERSKVREQIGCKSFDWYLKNVYNPDTVTPPPSRHVRENNDIENNSSNNNSNNVQIEQVDSTKSVIGKYLHMGTGYCISVAGESIASVVTLQLCSKSHIWFRSSVGPTQITLASNNLMCMDTSDDNYVILNKCNHESSTQIWSLKTMEKRKVLYQRSSGLCMCAPNGSQKNTIVEMKHCDINCYINIGDY